METHLGKCVRIILKESKLNLFSLLRHNSWSHKRCIRHFYCTHSYIDQLSICKSIFDDRSVHRLQSWPADGRHACSDICSYNFRDGSGDGGISGAFCSAAGGCPVVHQFQLCSHGGCCCRAEPRPDDIIPVCSRVSIHPFQINSKVFFVVVVDLIFFMYSGVPFSVWRLGRLAVRSVLLS